MMKGKLFVLEGLNGCGKTTVMNKLRVDFPDALFTREPGGSEYGEDVRKILLSDVAKDENALTHFLGFWSARSSHFDRVIIPAITAGRTVFSDRMDASTYAFQIIAGRNHQLEELFFQLRRTVINSRIPPPQYIYLNTSVQTSVTRSGQKPKDHFDERDMEYQNVVARGYKMFFRDRRISCFVSMIDAERDPEAVYSDVLSIVRGI